MWITPTSIKKSEATKTFDIAFLIGAHLLAGFALLILNEN
jgi:hypothetical protein